MIDEKALTGEVAAAPDCGDQEKEKKMNDGVTVKEVLERRGS